MRYPFRFRFNRWAIVLFWVFLIAALLILYFFFPSIFFHVTQSYERTPFIQTP